MQCPQGHGQLAISDRQGIEIDYCPECRGVWLDRGELDKLIERSVPSPEPVAARGRDDDRYRDRRDDDRRKYDERRHYDDDYRYYGKKKKRESFLGELFDF